jgi:hypothetical protein
MEEFRSKRVTFQPWERQSDIPAKDDISLVIPKVGKLSVAVQNELVAMIAEFVGTFMFLLFAYGGTTAVNVAPVNGTEFLGANPARLLYIALCFGISLAVNVVGCTSLSTLSDPKHRCPHGANISPCSGCSIALAVVSSTQQ